MSGHEPGVKVLAADGPVRAVVLVLHGGSEWGDREVRPWRLAYLRMVPIGRAVRRACRDHGVEVRLLRNRVHGWNPPKLPAVEDARWALERIRAEHSDVPIVLVGHSMGARVALRVADDPNVVGVCALAPWTPDGEPVEPVRDRAVLIVHGLRDRMIDPGQSFDFATRAQSDTSRLARFELAAEGHAMLARAQVWTRLVCAFTLDVLGAAREDKTMCSAWTKPSADRLRIPL
ncbi:alpha/beta hydrolase [Amycolatopsis sp. CA-230715]|uniref:alpha/beta hydrolase n=1 Tax=Amycolatopsis sp. CA-230715 TaxID=2745196 RepID=UPI001C039858|nr:alpha/beta fold hydrolase [Amycolatopsis sp. CA-230715]QWF84442.1 hypothetical protein HUW46_07892 [Amycolatopsis sp. CA-230715]